jgi:hypothetical protein
LNSRDASRDVTPVNRTVNYGANNFVSLRKSIGPPEESIFDKK